MFVEVQNNFLSIRSAAAQVVQQKQLMFQWFQPQFADIHINNASVSEKHSIS